MEIFPKILWTMFARPNFFRKMATISQKKNHCWLVLIDHNHMGKASLIPSCFHLKHFETTHYPIKEAANFLLASRKVIFSGLKSVFISSHDLAAIVDVRNSVLHSLIHPNRCKYVIFRLQTLDNGLQ